MEGEVPSSGYWDAQEGSQRPREGDSRIRGSLSDVENDQREDHEA